MNMKLAAALLLLPMTLAAQEVSASSQKSHRNRGPEAVVVSMQFGGGTLAEFVAAVRQEQPNANIVLATGAREAKVPPIVLKGAGLEQALEGACTAVDADYQVRVKEFRGAGAPVYSIVPYRQNQSRRAAGPVGPAGLAAIGGRAKSGKSTQNVFSLNDLTARRMGGMKSMPVATILSAIELGMAGEKASPRIRFHQDSGLLLVRGSNDQLNLVSEMLATLRRDMDRREQREVQRMAEARRTQQAKQVNR